MCQVIYLHYIQFFISSQGRYFLSILVFKDIVNKSSVNAGLQNSQFKLAPVLEKCPVKRKPVTLKKKTISSQCFHLFLSKSMWLLFHVPSGPAIPVNKL